MTTPALRLVGLDAYYGLAQALFGLDLEVPKGSVTVLLGRNGAGKSTTMKAIMGLVKLGRGSIEVDGRAVNGWPSYRVNHAGVGYVPEERRVFAGLSVEENLIVGTHYPVASVARWTHERVFDLFPALAGLRERLAGQLSGGEQQMLTIARTLMGNPGIILLDEPSEGLAPVILQQIAATVKTLSAEGMTVLLSEQNVRFATYVADRAAVIERGKVLAAGPMDEIASNARVRDAYLTP
ncbi:MAG: ABC transporter ATP-binding protein [Alphaproteobacteria bacterium]|jgi:branched-chain amino acid transport system ATP-binding protein|nr:ABC transporter ATP-binding protein [Alphaproteobacteria bacterium]